MREPDYSKSFPEHYGEDFRRDSITKYKSENNNVISILDEIAAKRAEVVYKTPFDFYEDDLYISIALKVIDQYLQSIYTLIQSNLETTRQFVEETILPL